MVLVWASLEIRIRCVQVLCPSLVLSSCRACLLQARFPKGFLNVFSHYVLFRPRLDSYRLLFIICSASCFFSPELVSLDFLYNSVLNAASYISGVGVAFRCYVHHLLTVYLQDLPARCQICNWFSFKLIKGCIFFSPRLDSDRYPLRFLFWQLLFSAPS